uniref:Prolyl oligopeptidase family serine peptidase n=1 Tax=Roseihalotalea indica TaxID=2867963 RepID=A0AA49JFS5_9BACT|nr:prolyl oligopeptidase family serine peptidase [Tunicatimonas sp. TK19036]
MMYRLIILITLLMGILQIAYAQQALPPYLPTQEEIEGAYASMAELDTITDHSAYRLNVNPHWQPDSEAFWYQNILKDSVLEYMYVDATKGHKQKAFDHERLADALEKASGESLDAARLPITDMQFNQNASSVRLQLANQWWECDLTSYTCQKSEAPEPDTHTYPGLHRARSRWQRVESDSISPNQQWAAFIKDGNIFITSQSSGEEIQLTTEGSITEPFGDLNWSPDGRFLVGYHTKPVEDEDVHLILTSEPNTTRGQLDSRDYPQPGDPFPTYVMYVFNMANRQKVKVDTDTIDFFGAPFLNWHTNGNKFTYERVDRGHQRFRIIEVDAQSGKTRNIIDQKTNTFIYEQRIFTYYMPDTEEILWVTEKDGWRHIYLVDGEKGELKQQVTQGDWVVRAIDSIDTEKREIWFQASGMNTEEDPYFIHYYRIGFDGKKLVKLTPEEGNHHASYSPNKKYFVDTYSTVNTAPKHELRHTSDGKLITLLEEADLNDYLATGIRLPEVFHTTGRDDKTEIWGIVCRPRDFDSTKRYPIIENIYAGPQDSFVPKSFRPYGEMQSLAELGFIVVMIDGMGTDNRSKAFHDVCWKNLADAGFPDRIKWIKALAEKYPYMDTTRVGIYGTSAGGQSSTGALLFHPDFYIAAVSSCGCHDNRVDKRWWNEQWMGYPVGPNYEEQSNVTNAHKLQGDLMLMVGEADKNVPPESTYRVVDALIKAEKDFDFLVIPGMGHSDGGPYGRRRKRDFFVEKLLKAHPPQRNNQQSTISNEQ